MNFFLPGISDKHRKFDSAGNFRLLKPLFSLTMVSVIALTFLLYFNLGATTSSNTDNCYSNLCINKTEIIDNCLVPNCNFFAYNIECLGQSTYRVCLFPDDQSGIHNWTLNFTGGSQSSTAMNPCFTFTSMSSTFTITHTITDENETCSLLKEFNASCGFNCETINFTYSSPSCSTTTMNFNGELGNYEIYIDYGDNTDPERVFGLPLTHQYPQSGGNYIVCITFKRVPTVFNLGLSIFDDIYTCCFPIIVPVCTDPCGTFTFANCQPLDPTMCCRVATYTSNHQPLTYEWFLNGILQGTSTTNTFTFNFDDEGPHDICVKYTFNNKFYECCVSVSFPSCKCCNTANFALEDEDVVGSCLHEIFTVEPYCTIENEFVRHKWIYSDGFIYEGLNPPPHIFTNYVNSTGEVCITHEVRCGNNVLTTTKCDLQDIGAYLGHPGQETKMTDIIFPAQHPQGISVYNFITLYGDNVLIPLLIDGTLIVDTDVAFLSGFWFMAYGSAILVQEGITFELSGTTIQSVVNYYPSKPCCRWLGITAMPNTHLTWDYVTVSHAIVGLTLGGTASTNGATLNFFNNDLTENITGIRSVGHRFKVESFEYNTISGCLDCNVTCGCSEGNGIELYNIPLTGISFPSSEGQNIITSFTNGVLAHNSTLSIRHFDIIGIEFNGIQFTNIGDASRHLTMDYMNFEDMKTGVYDNITNGITHTLNAIASVPLSSIKMSNLEIGYDIYIQNAILNGNIKFNKLLIDGENVSHGIQCFISSNSNNTLNAQNNNITVDGGDESCSGISLNSFTNNPQLADIRYNTIECGSTGEGNGIFVANWKNTKVRDNIIDISNEQFGIRVNQSSNSLISCNNITHGARGMAYFNTPELIISTNTCFNNDRSMTFEGACNGTGGTRHAFNTLNSSAYQSINYETRTTITGQQLHSNYNRYIAQSGVEVYHPSIPLASASRIRAPLGATPGSIYYPAHSPSGLIMFRDGPPASIVSECGSIGGGGISGMPNTPFQTGSDYNELLSLVDLYTDMTIAEIEDFKISLILLIEANSSWLIDFPNIANFYTTENSGFIGLAVDILQEIDLHSINLDNQYEVMSLLQLIYDGTLNQIQTIEAQLAIETDPLIILNLQNQLLALENQLASNLQDIKNLNITNQAINATQINAIESLILSVNPLSASQSNFKSVYLLIIKLMEGQSLSETDKLTLRTIAQECSIDGGRWVHQANEICNSLLKEYYSPEVCLEEFQGEITSRITKSNEVIVYPNPADDELMINLGSILKTNEIPEIKLINLEGKPISIIPVCNNAIWTVKTTSIPDGMYILQVKGNAEDIKTRIIINH